MIWITASWCVWHATPCLHLSCPACIQVLQPTPSQCLELGHHGAVALHLLAAASGLLVLQEVRHLTEQLRVNLAWHTKHSQHRTAHHQQVAWVHRQLCHDWLCKASCCVCQTHTPITFALRDLASALLLQGTLGSMEEEQRACWRTLMRTTTLWELCT
jgi:hypothetical protein